MYAQNPALKIIIVLLLACTSCNLISSRSNQNKSSEQKTTNITDYFYKNDLVFDKGWKYVAIINWDEKKKDWQSTSKINRLPKLENDILCYSAKNHMLTSMYSMPDSTYAISKWKWYKLSEFPVTLEQEKWKYLPKQPWGYKFIGFFTYSFAYDFYYFNPKTEDIMFASYSRKDVKTLSPHSITFWLHDSISPLLTNHDVIDSFKTKVPLTINPNDIRAVDSVFASSEF